MAAVSKSRNLVTLALTLLLLGVGLATSSGPNELTSTDGTAVEFGDVAWMLTATGLVMLMTPGLSFFYGGMVRGKHAISTMLQSFIALAVISLVWVVFGFSLAFGDSLGGVIGDPRTFFMLKHVTASPHPLLCATIPLSLFVLFQLKFAIITPALITGAFAERVRFSAYLLFMVLFSIVVYAPLAHSTWHPDGLLRKLGVLDFAGGTVVHISAGVAALAGARYFGPRRDTVSSHEPSNIPFVLLGTGMLWFGWFGFNAGSALAANATAISAFMTTNTASAAAAAGWLLCDSLRGRKPSALGACVGAVVGLVAITPGAGFVGLGASIFIGAFSAIVSNFAVHLKSKSNIDDTLDVFPCHGVGGIVGMILTAVFAVDGGLVNGSAKLLGAHLLTLVIIVPAVYVISHALYRIVDALIPLRVGVDEEMLGLDLSQHGESVYSLHASVPSGDSLRPMLEPSPRPHP